MQMYKGEPMVDRTAELASMVYVRVYGELNAFVTH